MNFVVIGGGGTGGRLVPLLAQFIKTANWIINPRIFVVDHDEVEEKNLTRQNFIKLDLGRPKAVVLAERYSKAFDINITPVVEKIDRSTSGVLDNTVITNIDGRSISGISIDNIQNAMIMLCVDSAQARKDILNRLFYNGGNRNLFILDSGNENDFGQIQLFSDAIIIPSAGYAKETVQGFTVPGLGFPFDEEIPFIPVPMEFYANLKDAEQERSCAELDQTLAINAVMATTMMGIIQNFIFGKKIPFHKINISLTYGAIPEIMDLRYIVNAMFETHRIRNSSIALPYGLEIKRVLDDINIKIKNFNPSKEESKPKKKTIPRTETLAGPVNNGLTNLTAREIQINAGLSNSSV